MRILLATAVAIAPLTIAAGAQAQVVISNARTTPITTANATGTGPDSIRLASGGSIAVTSGAAITVNSNHNVTLDAGSRITMDKAADGATGILVNGGSTSNLTISGTIQITDDLETSPDTDNDGDLDGPFATGTGRYGVRLAGAGPVTGDVRIETGGSITVEGNQSYGVALETDLNGSFRNLGTIRVTGDETVGVRLGGDISQSAYVGGSIAVQGRDAVGLSVEGDVAGRLTVQGGITATGYRYPTRGSQTAVDKLDEDDLLQGGPAVLVAGNVGGGLVFDIPPAPPAADDDDAENPDRDGDGIPDASEGQSVIATFGGAPAVLVASADQSITLGVAGTGDEAFGFINRGQISGSGVYDGVNASGVRIGGDGSQSVVIEGGLLNSGAITSTAAEGTATAVIIGAGASTPRLVNRGSIAAGLTSEDGVLDATGVRIDQGATVPSLVNGGSIVANSVGEAANAVAVRDLSGTLTSITNTGSIQTVRSPSAADQTLTGRSIAIDVSANTTGVTFVQEGVQGDPDDDGFVDSDGDGVADSAEPIVRGDILLGSGADIIDVRNGTVTGDISFGAGADRLSITGGGVVTGAIDSGDGQLDIDIANGRLDARHTSEQTISSLNVGGDGALIVTLDPQSDESAGFNVTGTANLADGASLGVRFSSLIDGPERFSLIRAGSLVTGDWDRDTVQENSPYLFVVDADADIAAGEVFVDVRRRTAEEANLIKVEGQAFDAIYQALYDNEVVRNAFLNQLDRDGFIDLYEQMLPDHSGGPLLSLASGVDAVTRALTGRNASAAPGETSAWVQEINFYADKDKTDSYGFRSEGFGFAGGVERGTNLGAFGITTAFTSSDLKDPEAEAEEVLSASLFELGAYWRAQGQYWTTWARAAAGYASFDSTRQLVGEGLNLRTESDWHGFTLAAAGGASYERTFGRVNVRPEVYLEYFSLSEEGHTETGGGDGFDLDFDKRNGHLFSAVAAMNVGYGFGQNGWLRPELRLGWRQNISVDAGETIARFASGGPDFRLSPGSIEGGGPILGFRLNVGNELGMLSITGDAELLEDYVRYSLLLRASFRF
jgi:Autotransporter beta-domain